MKKLIWLFAAIFILTPALTQAKNGPHAGPVFAGNTDICASCHRSHSGTTAPLLGNDATSIYSFCTYCHDGTGANANVVSGIFEGDQDIVYPTESGADHNTVADGDPGKGLNGGGYQGAYSYTGRWGRGTGYRTFGSDGDGHRHNVTGEDTNTYLAYGGGSTGPGQDIAGFTCVSCHDPHGTENEDGTERYRILKGGIGMMLDSTVNGKLTGEIKSNEVEAFGKHDYTKDAHQAGIVSFCIACHTQYATSKGIVDKYGNVSESGKYNSGDDNGSVVRHRHKMVTVGGVGDMSGIRGQGQSVWDNMNTKTTRLPLSQDIYNQNLGPNDSIICLTCHQAHGTAANTTTNAQVKPANSSTLLRIDNRGVCEACHYK